MKIKDKIVKQLTLISLIEDKRVLINKEIQKEYIYLAILKKEMSDRYKYFIGKKANCLTDHGYKILICNKVIVNEELRTIFYFEDEHYKRVKALEWDFKITK